MEFFEKRGPVKFLLGSVLSKRSMVDSSGRNSKDQSFMMMAVELWVTHRAMAAAIAVAKQKRDLDQVTRPDPTLPQNSQP